MPGNNYGSDLIMWIVFAIIVIVCTRAFWGQVISPLIKGRKKEKKAKMLNLMLQEGLGKLLEE